MHRRPASRSGRRSALVVVLALGMVMLMTQQALAAGVNFANGVVTYFGASTETNSVLISIQPGPPVEMRLEELGGVGISPGSSCRSAGAPFTVAFCPNAVEIRVNTGAGNDGVTNLAGIRSVLEGFTGNDTLRAGSNHDRLFGQDDVDTLLGAEGNDVLDGGPGDDLFEGLGPVPMPGFPFGGSDTIIGGDGFDRMFYFARSNPVFVELDNIANDGEAGENDNVHTDVEWVSGGAGNDTILARAGAQQIFGRAGNDHLAGGFGTDLIDGGDGVDTLSYSGRTACAVRVTFDGVANDGCSGENDNFVAIERVLGSEGADELHGGSQGVTFEGRGGQDDFFGSSAEDVLSGGDGDDLIFANEGVADRVRCGPGSDIARVDLKDTIVVPSECESTQGAAFDQFPNVEIGRRPLRSTPNGRVSVRLICPPEWTPGCNGTLRLRTLKGRGLGKRDYQIAPGESERLTVRLNRLGRRLGFGDDPVRIRAEANELDRNGLPKTTIGTLLLRPRT